MEVKHLVLPPEIPEGEGRLLKAMIDYHSRRQQDVAGEQQKVDDKVRKLDQLDPDTRAEWESVIDYKEMRLAGQSEELAGLFEFVGMLIKSRGGGLEQAPPHAPATGE